MMEVTKEVIQAQANHNKAHELGVSDTQYLNDLVTELADALEAMVEEWTDYQTINNLGNPDDKHNIKRAKAALAKIGR